MDALDKAVGDAVRTHRLKRKLALDDLARITNQSKSGLSRLECGQRRWSVSGLNAVADALRIDAGRLLTRARAAFRAARQEAP